jgi:uncharacterized membrane protein
MNESSEHAQLHIDSIAKQENEALENRTITELAGDWVAGFVGSLTFVLIHAVLVLLWILANTIGLFGIPRFDPYPFSLLGFIVAVEAVVFSSFILMRQNRMAKHAERRDHLHLQIDLIAEKEITKLLQMVGEVSAHLGLKQISEDKELKEFTKATSVETLAQRIDDTLPDK